MCYGHVDLKHLTRETESRLAGLPQVDASTARGPGLFARLGLFIKGWRKVPHSAGQGDLQS